MSSTGTVSVDHHQFVVGSPSAETYEPSTTGSVIEVGPNFVTIMTGVAYGPVAVSIESLPAHPGEPTTPSEWEVVEEATIKVTSSFRVLSLDGEVAPDFFDIPIPKGWNTFRVSARGRDACSDLTVSEPTEEYLVEIWKASRPAPMRRIHKRDRVWDDDIVSHKARNWWDPDPAGDATLYLEYGYEQMAVWAKQDAIDWGGRPPTDKLRNTAYAKQFAAHDRMLVDALARTRAPKLRKIAARAARCAYTIAGVADIEWIRDGLDALDSGTPLPHPFTDRHSSAVIDAFYADERIQLWTTSESGEAAPTAALAAVNALTDASWTDPLPALFNVLWTLLSTRSSDYAGLIADLRQEFYPKLAPADQYERWIGLTVADVP